MAIGCEDDAERGADIATDADGAGAGAGGVFIGCAGREHGRGDAVVEREAGAAGIADVAGLIGRGGADHDGGQAVTECVEVGGAEQHGLPGAGAAGSQALEHAVAVGAEGHEHGGTTLGADSDGAAGAAGQRRALIGRSGQQLGCCRRELIEHEAGAGVGADVASCIGGARCDADAAIAQRAKVARTERHQAWGGAGDDGLAHAVTVGAEGQGHGAAVLRSDADGAGTGGGGAFKGIGNGQNRHRWLRAEQGEAGAAGRAGVAGLIGSGGADADRALAERERIDGAEHNGLCRAGADHALDDRLTVAAEGDEHGRAAFGMQGDGATGGDGDGRALAGGGGSQHGRTGRYGVEHEAGVDTGAVLAGRVRAGADADGAIAQCGQVRRAEREQGWRAAGGEGLGHALAIGTEDHGERSACVGADADGAACGARCVLLGRAHAQLRRGDGVAEHKTGTADGAGVARQIGGHGFDRDRGDAVAECVEVGGAEHDGLRRAGASGGERLDHSLAVGAEGHHHAGAAFGADHDGTAETARQCRAFIRGGCNQQRRRGRNLVEHETGSAGGAEVVGGIGSARRDADRAVAQRDELVGAEADGSNAAGAGDALADRLAVGAEGHGHGIARISRHADGTGLCQRSVLMGRANREHRRRRQGGRHGEAGAARCAAVAGGIGDDGADADSARAQGEHINGAQQHGLRRAGAGQVLDDGLAIGAQAHAHAGAAFGIDGYSAQGAGGECRVFGAGGGHQNGSGRRRGVEHKAGRGNGAGVALHVGGGGADADEAIAQNCQISGAEGNQRRSPAGGQGLGHRMTVGAAENNAQRRAVVSADADGTGRGAGGILLGGAHVEQRRADGIGQNKAGAARDADVARQIGGDSGDGHGAQPQRGQIGRGEVHGLG